MAWEWTQGSRQKCGISVLHVSGHWKTSATEEALNNQVKKITCLTGVSHSLSLAIPEPAYRYMNGGATMVVLEAVYELTSMESHLKGQCDHCCL